MVGYDRLERMGRWVEVERRYVGGWRCGGAERWSEGVEDL